MNTPTQSVIIRLSQKPSIRIFLLIIGLCSGYCKSQTPARFINETKAPYEATWVELDTSGGDYSVYYLLDASDNQGKTRAPITIKIHGGKVTWSHLMKGIHDLFVAPASEAVSIETVKKTDNGSYYFQLSDNYYKYLSFQQFDNNRHIARLIRYDERDKHIISDYLYVDSLYNTFPRKDFKSSRRTKKGGR